MFLMESIEVSASAFLDSMRESRGCEIILQLLHIYIAEPLLSSHADNFGLDDFVETEVKHECDDMYVYASIRMLLFYMDANINKNEWEDSHVTWLVGNIANFLKKAPHLLNIHLMMLLIGGCVGEVIGETASLDGSQSLKHPQLLLLIWMLLPSAKNAEVLEHIMIQSSILLKSDEDIQSLILQQEGWQATLLPLARHNHGMGHVLARDLFTSLICKAMGETDGYNNWLVCVSCALKITLYSIKETVEILRTICESVIGRISRERVNLTKDLSCNLSSLILFTEIFLFDDNGLVIGLDPSLSEAQKSLSSSSFLSTLKLYSSSATILLYRVLDFMDDLISLNKLDLPVCNNLLRIVVCCLCYFDMENIQRCIQLLLTYINKVPPSYLNDKHLTYFILWGLDNAIQLQINGPLISGSLISLYLSLTDSLPDMVKSIFGNESRRGSINESEYKRRCGFLMDYQNDAAKAYAASRQDTVIYVCSQPVVSSISSPQMETICSLASESGEVSGRPPEINEGVSTSQELVIGDFLPTSIENQDKEWKEIENDRDLNLDLSLTTYLLSFKSINIDGKEENASDAKGETSFAVGDQEDLNRMRRILKRLNKKKNHLSHAEAGHIFRIADQERKKKLEMKIGNFITVVDVSKEEKKIEVDDKKGTEKEEQKKAFYKEGEEESSSNNLNGKEKEIDEEDDSELVANKVDSGGASEELIIITVPCKMYIPQGAIDGVLKITSKSMFFSPNETGTNEDNSSKTSTEVMLDAELSPLRVNRVFEVNGVTAIYCRRHRLQDTAIELFFEYSTHRENFFLNFEEGDDSSTSTRNKGI